MYKYIYKYYNLHYLFYHRLHAQKFETKFLPEKETDFPLLMAFTREPLILKALKIICRVFEGSLQYNQYMYAMAMHKYTNNPQFSISLHYLILSAYQVFLPGLFP